MIRRPVYCKRSHRLLLRALKDAQNALQLRDWQITLDTGNYPSTEFLDSDNGTSTARSSFHADLRTGLIWVSDRRAKQHKEDPLFNLYHELGHFVLSVPDDELNCNIIAKLLYDLREAK